MKTKTSEYVRREYTFGPLNMTVVIRNGQEQVRLDFGDGIHIWAYPIDRIDHSQSPAEELAKALALIDGRFEVRRLT